MSRRRTFSLLVNWFIDSGTTICSMSNYSAPALIWAVLNAKLPPMESVSYWGAWVIWWNGDQVTGLKLWLWDVLWWGRVGKTLGLAGAGLIVAELVGAKRLRLFGEGLRERLDRTPMWVVLRWMMSKMTGDKQLETDPLRYVIATAAGSIIIGSLIFAGVGVGLYVLSGGWDIYGGPLWRDFVASVLVLTLISISFSNLLVVVPLVVTAVLVGPFEILAKLLASDKTGNAMKILTVLLIAVGFHFDLLAS